MDGYSARISKAWLKSTGFRLLMTDIPVSTVYVKGTQRCRYRECVHANFADQMSGRVRSVAPRELRGDREGARTLYQAQDTYFSVQPRRCASVFVHNSAVCTTTTVDGWKVRCEPQAQ